MNNKIFLALLISIGSILSSCSPCLPDSKRHCTNQKPADGGAYDDCAVWKAFLNCKIVECEGKCCIQNILADLLGERIDFDYFVGSAKINCRSATESEVQYLQQNGFIGYSLSHPEESKIVAILTVLEVGLDRVEPLCFSGLTYASRLSKAKIGDRYSAASVGPYFAFGPYTEDSQDAQQTDASQAGSSKTIL